MPLSAADAAALRIRLAVEAGNHNGTFDQFDEEEKRNKYITMKQQQRLENSESEEDEDGDEDMSDDGEEEDDSEAASVDPEFEAELIAEVRAERRAIAEARQQKKEEKKAEAKAKQEQIASINLAKRLAHNDKKVRDSSIKSLRKWLLRRSELDDVSLMKIWKGLFYCFWMSDKVPIQQALAESVSDLLLPPLPFERGLLLFKTGLITLRREWTSIDQLRMDKFMTLVRRLIHRAFLMIQVNNFESAQVEALADCILETHVVATDTQVRGFAFHFIDCFLEELERIHSSNEVNQLPFDGLNTLLTPFYHILARAEDETLVNRTKKEVFDKLRELCFTPLPVPKKEKSKKKGKKQVEEEEEEEVQLEGLAAELPYLHQLVHDNAESIAAVFEEMAKDTDIFTRRRKLLYSYRGDFLQATEDQSSMNDIEDEAIDEAPAAPVVSKKKSKGLKRKAEDSVDGDATPVAGVGAESLADIAREKAKKLNKKQRLAAKRKKRDAILGAEPVGTQLPPSQDKKKNKKSSNADEAEDEYDIDEMDEAELDEAMDQFDDADMDDIDIDEGDDDDSAPSLEAEVDEDAIVPAKISKQEQKKLDAALKKKNAQKNTSQGQSSKKRIQPELIPEESDVADEAEPVVEDVQPKKKKAKVSPAPVEPEPIAEPVAVVEKKSAKKSKSSNESIASVPSKGAVVPNAPTVIPAPVDNMTTPTKPKQPSPSAPSNHTQSPPSSSTFQSVTSTSSLAFSTPQHSKPLDPIIRVGGTVVRVAPPSSSKKNFRIVLSNNKVKEFKKFSRDSVTTGTSALLAKPSPRSAIKQSSMEFFLSHNKNGQELAARQVRLTTEFSEAATDSNSTPKKGSNKSTPPTSPSRPKAADFFFKE